MAQGYKQFVRNTQPSSQLEFGLPARDATSVSPRKEVIWLDQYVDHPINIELVSDIRMRAANVTLYTTKDPEEAYSLLKQVDCTGSAVRRLVASGRIGEGMVRRLRDEGVLCDVLIFCSMVNYHYYQAVAKSYPYVQVTCADDKFLSFASWNKI